MCVSDIWGLWPQKQVSRTGISNYIPEYSMWFKTVISKMVAILSRTEWVDLSRYIHMNSVQHKNITRIETHSIGWPPKSIRILKNYLTWYSIIWGSWGTNFFLAYNVPQASLTIEAWLSNNTSILLTSFTINKTKCKVCDTKHTVTL